MTTPPYWLTAEALVKKSGIERALVVAERMIKISPKSNKEFWHYVLASLRRMQEKTLQNSNDIS